MLPADLRAKAGALATPGLSDYLAFCKAAAPASTIAPDAALYDRAVGAAALHRTADVGRRRVGAVDRLAVPYPYPETKTQAVTGPEFHGKTLIRYMHDLGLLHSGTTIAHSIWVTDEDIALMADAGCSIVHNVISNQKLGAGIAPLRKLLDAGVNVALGSDGICSNDTPRMFDVGCMAAGLLHSVSSRSTPGSRPPRSWNAPPSRGESALLGHETGSLEAGKKRTW